MKDNLLISFSGGATSAYMAIRLLRECTDQYNFFCVFANTGQEREETLEFVYNCDSVFGLGTAWVEAKVHEKKQVGTTHTVVNFLSASRLGEPFEQVIQKYGIPNINFPHCTRELKMRPIHSYMRSLGVPYVTAIGIRADEYRRVSKRANADNIVYPLADWWQVSKENVQSFREKQSFKLQLKEHQGNCVWCWKKSFKKLFLLWEESPEIFSFPKKMEKQYANSGPSGQPQCFFRGGRTTEDLIRDAIKAHNDKLVDLNVFLDDGCSESCEMYETI